MESGLTRLMVGAGSVLNYSTKMAGLLNRRLLNKVSE
jgi:hypothetical protein